MSPKSELDFSEKTKKVMFAKLMRKMLSENVHRITIYFNSIMMKFAYAGFQPNDLGWKLR